MPPTSNEYVHQTICKGCLVCLLVMCKMLLGLKTFYSRLTQMIHLNVYKFDKTFDHTLRFCRIFTPKSLQNVPKSPQITPEVTKIMHLGHIFFTGPRQTTFFTVPLPFPNRGKPPYFRWPYGPCFSFLK